MPMKLRRRDLRFVALVGANLAGIAGFLVAGLRTADETPGGWRRIDREALEARIEAGDLVRHEARWYRVVEED